MLNRIVMTVLLAGLIAAGSAAGVRAQQPVSAGLPAASSSGWSYNVAPYLWIASINSTANFSLPSPAVGTVNANSSVGFGDIISHLNFATMVAADAQYDKFSILTDFIYMNLGATPSQFRSVNFPNHPNIPITASAQATQGLNLNAKVWTLAGGYTVLKGDWGNFDAIAGVRYLGIPMRVNYSLGFTVTGPRGASDTFGGVGSVSGTVDLWNGIGGFRGRFRIADTGLFIPYYFDAGAGGSNFTWQIASGLGYHLSWVDVSVTYRYLSFEQSNNAVLEHLWIEGPMLMANIPL
jgi:hypothetical protein